MIPRGNRETTTVHPGRNLVGGEEEEDIWRELHAVGAGGRVIWEVGMLRRRQETPRWENDLVW